MSEEKQSIDSKHCVAGWRKAQGHCSRHSETGGPQTHKKIQVTVQSTMNALAHVDSLQLERYGC